MLAGAISFLVNAINAINSFDHRRIMPLPLSMPSMPSTALIIAASCPSRFRINHRTLPEVELTAPALLLNV
jgi:hypothetical protein